MVHSVTVCCRVLFKFPRKAKRICLSLCLFASIFEALLVFFFFLYKAVTSKTMKKKKSLTVLRYSIYCHYIASQNIPMEAFVCPYN